MTRSWTGWLSAATLVLTLPACSSSPAEPQRAPAESVPAGPVISLGQAEVENRGVSAAASGDRVVAVWAATKDGSTDIEAATSEDAGATFSAPVRVNDLPGDARVNGEQPPRVAIAGLQVVVVWQSRRTGQPEVRAARSTDGGRSFVKAVTVHASGLTGSRGWSSVALAPSGEAHLTWLDTRNGAPPEKAGGAAAGAHQHGSSSTRQDVFQAVWPPEGEPVEGAVTTSVCFCCKTSTAVSRDGVTLVAFRHIYPTNLRDMAVARSTGGARTFDTPVRVSQDGWELTGCPEDGPALAVDDSNRVHIAWPTITGPDASHKGVFYAYSADEGRSFAPRIRLDEGTDVKHAQHPQLASAGQGAVVVWDEISPAGTRIRARVVTTKGRDDKSPRLSPVVAVSDPGSVTYPAVAATTQGYVVFWTENAESGAGIRARRFSLH
jgi:hypothetical protein